MKGDDAANRLQLRLLEGEELQQEFSGLEALRALPIVDRSRVAVIGYSFGGSLAMLIAEHDPSVRAVINFGAAAGSWNRSAYLRERLIAAARKLTVPIFLIYAANDYSTAPGEVLDGELAKRGNVHRLTIYPPFGRTATEGHSLIYLSMATWERDVFAFLDERVRD
jgi:dienelactone hydrolase